jgi:hypothetical protein
MTDNTSRAFSIMDAGSRTTNRRSWTTTEAIEPLQTDLNHFDPSIRASALDELATLARQGGVVQATEGDVANMHCHTFYSFNAYGHSPSSLAWLGKQHGIKLMGIVDFDVLDGVDEFLDACEVVNLRGSAGMETRVFVPEYASQEINSPGEPGVCYHMGIGFATGRVPDDVAPILADLGQRAGQRNQLIVGRLNEYLDPVTVDYQRDVLSLTPGGHPTERHMVTAYITAAASAVRDPAAFWAGKLHLTRDDIATAMTDPPRFQNLVRSKLIKRGGVGYVRPESGMFPTLDAFDKLIGACGALPCAAWLDGTSTAEQDPERWLGFLLEKGVVAVNVIPDRNWNIADLEVKERKVGNLYRLVALARELSLPLNVGTEMNSFGQKLIDDFDAPELAPVRQAFLDGAYFAYGHTALQRALALGYQSDWARVHLPTRRQRVEFYTDLGRRIPPGQAGVAALHRLDPDLSPDEMVSRWTRLQAAD